MPKQFADIVKLIAEKTNLDITDKSFIDLLTVNASVGDEVYNRLESGLNNLLTIESAKHNPALAAHFKANALLPADTEINNLLDELGFDDTIKTEFASEKSTYKKIGNLVRKVKELENKKAESKGGDKAALTSEINKLNQDIIALKKQSDEQIKQIQSEHENSLLQYALQSELKGKSYSESIPESVRLVSAQTLLEQELKKNGAKVIRTTDGALKLVRSENPELDYLENNKPVGFGEFTDKVLSTHAMLKVSDPNKNKGITQTKQISASGDVNPVMQKVADSNAAHLQKLEAALSS